MPKAAAKKTSTKRRGRPAASTASGQGHAPDSSPLPALPSDDDFVPTEVASKEVKVRAPRARAPRAPPPPRSPAPGRLARTKNPNPGYPDQPRTQRTSAAADADSAEIDALTATIARLEQEKLQTAARMIMEEEARAKALAKSTVMFKQPVAGNKPLVGTTFGRREQHQELDPHDSDEPVLEFNDDDFDAVVEADARIQRVLKANKIEQAKKADMYNLSKLPPLPAPPAKAPKGGRQKGAARAALAQAKEASHKRGLSGDERDFDPAPKKKLKEAFPVGLAGDWRQKVTPVGPSKNTGSKKAAAAADPIGGLGDDDLDDVRLVGVRGAQQYNTIEIESDSEDETPTKARPQPRPVAFQSKREEVIVKREAKPQPKSYVRVKAEPSLAEESEIAALPQFARALWCKAYLPTFYHFIGTRQIGWDICELGGEVGVFQHILDIVYPGCGYKVKKGCPIYNTAINRLGDKRHITGAGTLKSVDTTFESAEFAGRPHKIAKYAKWAIEDTGPAWYAHPAPPGTVSDLPGSVEPTGLYRSKYCLVPLAAFVKSTSQSRGDFGNKFVWAAAMICAGLERAFNQYTTGVKVLNGNFSKGRVGALVDEFTVGALRTEDWRWTRIMMACVGQMGSDDGQLLSASVAMNVNRRTMALGSSPPKGSDDDEM
ncbi:hypothetical protein DFH06DRAFT_1424132 [Mycena polygramma]|nr:hypothetical protein DFH06DRAFT_1424132 [Mycena polygramma]